MVDHKDQVIGILEGSIGGTKNCEKNTGNKFKVYHIFTGISLDDRY